MQSARFTSRGSVLAMRRLKHRLPIGRTWDAGHLKSCRFVACLGPEVLGWAALSPVSGRCVYAGVAEVSVYVAERARGRKIGARLLDALLTASEREGIWTLQAGIFPENVPSIELHKRAGFRIVGTREKLGSMDGRWRDVSSDGASQRHRWNVALSLAHFVETLNHCAKMKFGDRLE